MVWKIENITKNFGQVRALRGVSETFEEGKVYGLVGANGSGKSTMIKILTGVFSPDKGKVYRDEDILEITSPEDSQNYGIFASHQDLSLVPDLSVFENIFLGKEKKKSGFFIDRKKMFEEVIEIFDFLDLDIPFDEDVGNIDRSEMQMVESLKLYAHYPDLALFDEPTSYLTENKIEQLFKIIRKLKKEGKTVIFVSHRLEEIFEICDEVIVLKDGGKVGKFDLDKIDEDELASKMAGKDELKEKVKERTDVEKIREDTDSFFETRNLNWDSKSGGIDLKVWEGEIVGISGLTGQGQSKFLRSIYGLNDFDGKISLEGRDLEIGGPEDAIENGILYVSGDRYLEGVLPPRSVKENIALIENGRRFLFSLVDEDTEKELASEMIDELNIECESYDSRAESLSGGNQQKLFLGRGISESPDVLLLNDPFKGVDVMTKKSISKKMVDFRDIKAVIFYSSEVDDLINVCDRILVMYEGKIVDEFVGEDISKKKIEKSSIKGEE